MTKNSLQFKKLLIYMLLLFPVSVLYFTACDTAYKYDIEDGIDTNAADESGITVDTEGGIDVSMYEKARIFPGLVDTLREERVDAIIQLDLNKVYVDSITLGIRKSPQPIYSTGLYAGAGEQVSVIVEDGTMGLSVIIGSHMDDLTDYDPYQRMPVVYVSKALFPGTNVVKNPLGGTIWIKKSEELNKGGVSSVTFKDVYKSPDYVRGETNVQEWVQKVTETTVPWLEIRGNHFVFTVQKDRVLDNIGLISANLEEVVRQWDEAIEEFYYDYYGLKRGNNVPENQRAPEFPVRVVLDVLVPGNLYLRNSDHAIVAINNNYILDELLDIHTLRTGGSVALFRAINNMFKYRDRVNPWPTRYTDAVNAIPLYRMAEKGFNVENRIADLFPGEENIVNMFPLAVEYATADSSKWITNDKPAIDDIKEITYRAFNLLSLVQLAAYNDNEWELMKALNLQAKEERSIDNSDLSYFFRFLCDYFRQNFSPYFDHWGIELTDQDRVYGTEYPLMTQKIWTYNPLVPQQIPAYDESSYYFRHDRSDWKVRAYDKDYAGNSTQSGGPENLIDGSKSTSWNSGKNGDRPLELPYYLVFDLNKDTEIDGIYLANGKSGDCMADIHVEYMGQGGNPDDPSAPWVTLLHITEPAEVKAWLKNERFFACPTRTQVRYLRVKIENENTQIIDNPQLSEQEKQDQKKYHSLAEFGTYYRKP